MKTGNRQIIVVGDRVLLRRTRQEDVTSVGLILPQTVLEKEQVQAGHVVSTGPGIPVPDLDASNDEPWRSSEHHSRHIPLQAQPGDYALFLNKHAVEIEFDGQKYLIVPHSAILILLREEETHAE